APRTSASTTPSSPASSASSSATRCSASMPRPSARMLVGNPTTFTRRFLAAGGEVDAGEPTLPTCTLGTAWIYGRPHPLAPPGSLADVSIADRPKIVRFLANIDGRFSGLFRCRDGWVAATDIICFGPLFLRRRIRGRERAARVG